MTLIIHATIERGFGVANKNLKFQMPHLVWQFPDIKDIHLGTINVLLDKPLPNLNYDHTTLPLPWWDVDETHRGRWAVEQFSFLEIKFEYPVGGPSYRAWFFDCHNSSYHQNPNRFGIITHKIPNLSAGARCKVHVPSR